VVVSVAAKGTIVAVRTPTASPAQGREPKAAGTHPPNQPGRPASSRGTTLANTATPALTVDGAPSTIQEASLSDPAPVRHKVDRYRANRAATTRLS